MKFNGNVLSKIEQQDVKNGILIIPNNINEIGRSCCFLNKEVKTVFIPSSCTTIGATAFGECCNLENVYFYNNYNEIKDIILNGKSSNNFANNNVSYYGDRAFDGTKINEFAFGDNTQFVGKYVLGENVKKVDFNKNCKLDIININSFPVKEDLQIKFPQNCFFTPRNMENRNIETKICFNFDSVINFINYCDSSVNIIPDNYFINFDGMEKFGLTKDNLKMKSVYCTVNNPYPIVVLRKKEIEEVDESLDRYENEINSFKNNTQILVLENDKLTEVMPQELVDKFYIKFSEDMYRFKIYELTRTNNVELMYLFKKMLEKYNCREKMDFILLNKLTSENQIEQYVRTYKNFKLWRLLEKQVAEKSNEFNYFNNKTSLYNLGFLLGCFCSDEYTQAKAIDYIYNNFLKLGNKVNNLSNLAFFERLDIYENKVGEKQFEFLKTFMPEIIKYCINVMQTSFGSFDEIKTYFKFLCENFNELKQSCYNAKVEFNFQNSFKLSNLNRFSKLNNDKTRDIIREVSKYPQLDERSIEVVLNAKNCILNNNVSQNIFEPFNPSMLKDLYKEDNLKDKIYRNLDNGYCYYWINKYKTLNTTHAIEDRTGCAHLGSMGEGIVVASMIDEDCQNVRIVDKNGKGIARATVYLDRQKGVMLFNSFLVYNWTRKEKQDLKEILNTFKLATAEFIDAYQKNFPDNKKITLVNVGKGFNALQDLLTPCSENLLIEGKNFNEYKGDSGHYYRGDWQNGQYKFLSFGEIRQNLKRLEHIKADDELKAEIMEKIVL